MYGVVPEDPRAYEVIKIEDGCVVLFQVFKPFLAEVIVLEFLAIEIIVKCLLKERLSELVPNHLVVKTKASVLQADCCGHDIKGV
jgi:hypothetical protein